MTRDVAHAFNDTHGESTKHQARFITWKRGASDTYILNVDGNAQYNSRMTYFGGLIRDSNGGFMCEFYGNIGYSNILHVEMLALLHGIQLCWNEVLRNIICYIDSINTIHLVHYANVFIHHYENDIATIRKYMSKDWTFQLCRNLREDNMCAIISLRVK